MLQSVCSEARSSAALMPMPAGIADRALPAPCRNCLVRERSVCSALPAADMHHMSAITQRMEFEAGDAIVTEGDDAVHVFNITRGAVKVFRQLSDGRRQITGFLFAGDFLGLAIGDENAYSAEALGRVLVCRLPRAKFARVVEQFPSLERRLLRDASNELAAAQDQMLLLGRKTAREKVASFLLTLAGRLSPGARTAPVFDLAMTRLDIADYLGLTIETVSRIFTEFRKTGLISLRSAAEVELCGLERLAAVAEGA